MNSEERDMLERATVAKIVSWLRVEYQRDGLALCIASLIEQRAWQLPETPESLEDARQLREDAKDTAPYALRTPKTLAEMNAELDAKEPFLEAQEERDTERPDPPIHARRGQ